MSIQIHQVVKSFGQPPTSALDGVSLTIADGEFLAITGRSGSGKSTLLYIVSTLDKPTKGTVIIEGRDVSQMSEEDLHQFRNKQVGFVFQFHYLLPELTAIENVLMPCRKTGQEEARRKYATTLFENFGLSGKEDRIPAQLSGGEQQRVAIARALIMEPHYVFADEPTGNLDSHNGNLVMKLLSEINLKKKTTIIYVTHDTTFAAQAHRQITLVDGHLEH